jgi:autotransporter-associated beta strand protein
MKSWIRAWGVRAPVLLTGIAIAILGSTILTPAAEAASYRWTGAGGANANWNFADNWTRTDGPGTGFPNGPGDEAAFLGPYVMNVTAIIPGNVTITVGAITVPQSDSITIAAPGSGKLILDSGSASNAQISLTSASFLTLNAPVQLNTALSVHAAVGGVDVLKGVTALGNTQGVRKTGAGNLLFAQANTYTGATVISEGRLLLQSTSGPSIAGDLVIGDGNGPVQTAEVVLDKADQIADTARVTVNADGWLSLPSSDILGELIVNNGLVTTALATLTMRRVTMTGGMLLIPAGGNFRLEGPLTATSSSAGSAQIRRSGTVGTLSLIDASRTMTVNDGPNAVDLEISVPVVADTGSAAGLIKDGAGTLRFTGAVANTYLGATVVHGGRLELARNALSVPGPLTVETVGGSPAIVSLLGLQNIAASSVVSVGTGGLLAVGNHGNEMVRLNVGSSGRVEIGDQNGAGYLLVASMSMVGGEIVLTQDSRLGLENKLTASSTPLQPAVISGSGFVAFDAADSLIETPDGPQAIDLRIDARLRGVNITKTGAGVAQLTGANVHTGVTGVLDGTLLVTGTQPASPVSLTGGILGGTGTVGSVTAGQARVAPGMSPGRLSSGLVSFSSVTTFAVELNGMTPGAQYDQLAATGTVNLGNAILTVTVGPGFAPSKTVTFAILTNDGADPVVGTFAGLAEGATVSAGTREFTISYKGGDGNDVVLTAADDPPPPTYFLAEGATGEFFDEDVLIANPNTSAAPVTLTFFKDNGQQVVVERTLGPQSHAVVHVDEIPGLEAAVASVQVVSTSGQRLFVERSMFWDRSSYAGHTGSALDQPSNDWYFAEGATGFFQTFLLIVNPNEAATDVTLTFLRENEAPVVKTLPVGAGSRLTVSAGDFSELRARSFGMAVHATQPIMAERAMYFASLPGRPWGGGHESAGAPALSKQWYLAEGATGFFDTFILLGNPQTTPAQVTLRFLLSTGETIEVQKTIPASGRLTVNPAAEHDTRLKKATLSTVVTADVAIVAERSMYWTGATAPWGEAHNSFGVVEPLVAWGLAEGRLGGARAPFSTYILLANPQTTAAEVRVTFLRDAGAPIVKTYTVPATGRFTIDASTIRELRDSTFGASIVVTNGVPIVVERSMYWNANGIFWSGGTNATGIVDRTLSEK